MNTITVEQLLIFHEKIITSTGGSHGVRDRSLLESAISKANQTFDGQDLYDGIVRKISVITYSLIKNHGFIDGNKRVGVSVMLLLIRINGLRINYTQEELVEVGLRTAEGKFNDEDIAGWILRRQV
ncbi:type II toxin-antitoxin system death-on-curing family toxin [Cohnella yongneupensis]|uniref:Type II toxin-antitoxin system death-on-curing family toxin n=1 Tax=Cohnella yongneupensis TaxID=425006 RepID=A0ABW0QV79_9BACL